MSFEFYANWWIVTKKHLEDLSFRDKAFQQKKRTIADRHLANDIIGGFYVKYCLLVKEMAACYDQMVQPQKRLTVRKLMDAALVRLNEFNNEMRKISLSEFHYVDSNLIELKIVPYDVEILHPMLFYPRPFDVEDMWQKLKKGERVFSPPELLTEKSKSQTTEVETKAEDTVKPVESKETRPSKDELAKERKKRPTLPPNLRAPPPLTPEEEERQKRKATITKLVNLIQTAERARQERSYFFIKNLLANRKKLIQKLPPDQQPKPIENPIQEHAATVIQKVWKGYHTRQLLKSKEIQRRLLIGMYEPSFRSKYETERYKQNLEKRRQYRDQRMRDYLESIDQEKIRLLRVMAPGLLEDITDEIREWFHVWYVEAKTFDKYPPEEKGGTILVVRGETMTPKEYLDEYEKRRRAKVKGRNLDKEKAKAEKKKKEEEKKKKEAEKKKKEAEAKKRKKRKPGEFQYDYDPTAMNVPYDSGMEEYKKLWIERSDFDNPLEKHYMDLITDQKCFEVQLETRNIADQMMRIELEVLEDALEADKWRLKGKKGKPKKKKKKAKKKKKGKKKKGKKDMTANRTTEDLFQELFDNGIIRTYPEAYLEDYKGDFSYSGYVLRQNDFDPPATLLDLRQAVAVNCIIPLGVTEMKKPKSVLIAGPAGTGKHLLANAVFNESRCVLFDLSPEATAGKYPGKAGMKMLLHLITKMSKILAPSVIYFEAAEKIFYKKVPKEEKELDPKRIGKKLIKGIIKPITSQDRVLVLGITSKPWAGQAGKMKKAFERSILVPRPDYGSVFLYWRELIMSYHQVDRNFNVTALAKMTVNYPLPVLRKVLEEVLVPRRLIQLKFRPLTPEEVYEEFVSNGIEPISDKEYKKFLKWYYKSPLGKERRRFNKFAQEKRNAEAKAKERKR